jgi:ATP-dependent exoDNAse (exonuclease V) beta subunit
VCEEPGFSPEKFVRQCEEIVSAFLSSDLMKRVTREYCELPFVVTIDGRRVTGKIDRLCELSDGSWVVIDYKSEGALDYAALDEGYALSLSVYSEAARQIVRAEVAGWLYCTETGVLLEC